MIWKVAMITVALSVLFLGQKSPAEALLAQVKRDMIPLNTIDPSKALSDLAPLGKLLKGVQIVGIGEATHGTSEFCTMKHRMFRYLVEQQGFTVFGLEASMPDCLLMDDYVLTGKGDPKTAVFAQGFWTWSNQEMLDLILWMRQYNVNPVHKKKLRVMGYDMQSQVGVIKYFGKKEQELTGTKDLYFWEAMSWYPLDQESRATIRTKMDGSVKQIRDKYGSEEQKRAKFVEQVYFQAEKNTWIKSLMELQRKVIPTMMETFNDAAKLSVDLKLSSGEVFDALKFIDSHKDDLIDFPPDQRLKESRKMVSQSVKMTKLATGKDPILDGRINRQVELLQFLALALTSPFESGLNSMDIMSFRDRCMAENIVKGMVEFFPGQKMMAWAHNGHIMRRKGSDTPRSMGSFVAGSVGNKYYPIGFSFATGGFNAHNSANDVVVHAAGNPKPDSHDALFNQAGKPMFLLPMSKGYGSRTLRSIGSYYDPKLADQYYMTGDPAENYGALIFISKTTPTHLLK
jgi:erythromycin esterase-like protein